MDIVFIGVYLNCLLYYFQLEQEFELILHSSETMKTFEAAWKTWEPAIISYAKTSRKVSLQEFSETGDENEG